MPPNPAPTGISLADLAARIGATLVGDGSLRVDRVATLENAGPGALAFLVSARYRGQLQTTGAAAVIVAPAHADITTLPKLVHANPYAAYATAAAILHPVQRGVPGAHSTAFVAPSARVDPTATIGPHAVIESDAHVAARVLVGAGCVVGAGVTLGEDVVLHANVTIYPRGIVGARTIIHSGAVIGSDGFGMAEEGGRWLKIPQVGRVVIGADCEIGANTTVDRGAIDDTVLENDVKLDNQIQIGHNCVIGANTVIAGCTGISGSTTVGRDCMIGGGVGLVGHISICDNVTVSGFTLITKSITQPGTYTSGFPAMPHAEWLRNVVHLRRLHLIAEALKKGRTEANRDRDDD